MPLRSYSDSLQRQGLKDLSPGSGSGRSTLGIFTLGTCESCFPSVASVGCMVGRLVQHIPDGFRMFVFWMLSQVQRDLGPAREALL